MKLTKLYLRLGIVLLGIVFGCSPSDDSEEQNPPNTNVVPTLITSTTSNVGITTASSGGIISSDGGDPVTARGVVWSTSQNPTIALATKTTDGTGVGFFSSSITGLSSNTTYYLKAYATNVVGTGYGSQITFTTSNSPVVPTLITSVASSITASNASSGGNVSTDGGAAVTVKGVVWSTSQNPTVALSTKTLNGSGIGTFTSSITGLSANTTYYVRAYATNSVGTAYGNQISFSTIAPITSVTDIDGNTYPVVQICSQIWMAKNLNVGKYRNGDVIPQVQDPTQWANLTTGAWCYYANQTANGTVYGKLYNWYAVNDSRGLAPTGWHVSTNPEWNILETCAGGFSNAGHNLREAGTTHWQPTNANATNSVGFTALPGGWRNSGGITDFEKITQWGTWWTSSGSVTDPNFKINRLLTYFQSYIGYNEGIGTDLRSGYSVRCVKD